MSEKPKVIIDLEEYNQLLKIKDNVEIDDAALKVLNTMIKISLAGVPEPIDLTRFIDYVLQQSNADIVWNGNGTSRHIKSISNKK